MSIIIKTESGELDLSEKLEEQGKSVAALKKLLKSVRLSYLDDKKQFLEKSEELEKQNQDLQFQLQKLTNDTQQQISQNNQFLTVPPKNSTPKNTFDDFANIKQLSGSKNDETMSQNSASASTKTENLIINTAHFLSSGYFRYLKANEAQKNDEGECVDLAFTQRHIQLLKDKLQKKSSEVEKLKKQIEEKNKDLDEHIELEKKMGNGQNGKPQVIKEAHEHQEQDSRVSLYEEQIESLLKEKKLEKEDFAEKIQNAQEKLKGYEELQQKILEMSEKMDQYQAECSNVQQESEIKEKEFETQKAQYEEQIANLQKQIKEITEKNQLQQQNQETLNQEQTNLKNQEKEQFEKEKAKLQEKIAELEKQIKESKALNAEKIERENKIKLENLEKAKNGEIYKLANDISILEKRNQNQFSKIQELEEQITKLSQEKQNLINSLEDMKKVGTQLEQQYSEQNSSFEQNQKEIKELQEKLKEKEAAVKQKEDEIEDLKKLQNYQHKGEIDYNQTQTYSALLEANVNRLNNQLESLKQEIQKKDFEIEKLNGKLRVKDIEIQGKQNEVNMAKTEQNFLKKDINDLLSSFLHFKVEIMSTEQFQPISYDTENTVASEQKKSLSYTGHIYFRINEFGEYIFCYESLNDLVLIRAEDITKLKPESHGKNTFTITYKAHLYNNVFKKMLTKSVVNGKNTGDEGELIQATFRCETSGDYNAIMEKVQDYHKYARLGLEERKKARRAEKNNKTPEKARVNYLNTVLSFFGSDNKSK